MVFEKWYTYKDGYILYKKLNKKTSKLTEIIHGIMHELSLMLLFTAIKKYMRIFTSKLDKSAYTFYMT